MTDGFRGVFPAMITPMNEREELDLGKLEALADYLIGAGVYGLIPLGSTGEFYALTPQERRDVLATVLRAAAGRVPVVPGINAGATREVVQYAREAEALARRGCWSRRPTIRCLARMRSWNTSARSTGRSAFRSCSTTTPAARASI